MKINLSSKTYLLIIFVVSALIVWPLFLQGYFFHHDDLQVMRVFEMKKCFEDFQIPCRWVPDMGYGNGYPLFNYYSAFPYYIGGILTFFLSFVDASKALFFIPLVFGGISMFFLGQKLFGKDAGFLTAILYMFAPYRALDSYVRGAVAESFAIAIIPLVFYFFLKIIEKPTRINVVLGSLSLAAFLTSHNIMTMLFMPFVVFWGALLLYFNNWKNLKPWLISFILGIGIASFFLLPVFLEKNLVQTETLTQGGSNFRTHFVAVNQLFLDREWGYGGSVFGPNDTISFQIGMPLWFFVPPALLVIFLSFKNRKIFTMGIFFLVMFGVSIFMQHNKSAFIWEAVGPLQYTQFPWRFLSLSIFSAAILAGYVFNSIKFKGKILIIWFLAIITIFLNWNYFIPRDFYPWINDQNKLADPLWEIQQKAGILDYLPKTAYEPHGRAPDQVVVLSGNAQSNDYKVRSNYFTFSINVAENSNIQIPIFDFPNWTIYSNGQKITHDNKSNLGRISIELAPGNYQIKGVFENTPIRTASNLITLLSIICLIFILTPNKYSKKLLI